jgi:hypothetical protein
MAGGVGPSGWLKGALLATGLLGCGARAPQAAVLTEQSSRTVLEPVRFGWMSSERASGALPSAIALGGKASGRVLLYFEFATPGVGARRLLRADLVLGASGVPGEAIDVELSRADAAPGQLRAWSDQPHARYPRVAARFSTQALPQRLDVTELLRAQKPDEPLRLLLRAEPGSGEPVLVETGAAGGSAPRLETYWER